MPGPPPTAPSRAPLQPSTPAYSIRAIRAACAVCTIRSVLSYLPSLASLASLALLAALASPCFAGPAAGDSAPAPAIRLRPARWVPDTPPPGGLLWLDQYQGPVSGADNLLFAHGALSRIENRLLPTRLFEEERFFGRVLSVGYRLGKMNFLDLPAAYFLHLFQHEVFGHGWRAREAGFEDIEYDMRPPPPYGPGGGETSYDTTGSPQGINEFLAMSMAGIEAGDILSQRQRNRFLREGSMDYPGALVYLNATLGLANYATVTDTVETITGNDVSNWILGVNWKAGLDARSNPWYSLSDLKRHSLVALADPFFWYSAWTMGRYLWNGSMRWRQPMIPLGPVRWLPSLGYRLSPFGGQYLAENLLTLGQRAATLRAAWGDGELGPSWGADAEAQDLVRWRGWSLDAALRAWSQPPMRPYDRDVRPPEASRFGAGLSAAAVSPALFPGFPLRIAAGFSTKRAGYVPGESLGADFALRVGVGLYR